MSELFCIDITAREEDTDRVTGIMVLFAAAFGWEEESLPTGETRFRVYAENPRFCQELKVELAARVPDALVEESTVPNKDWVLIWRDFFTPVPIQDQFVVIAPWMRKDFPDPMPMPLIIEPKFAFGTGHHPTTALCLHALTTLFRSGRIRKGMRFLDLGTGSGILSVACAKLGLTGVAADIDMLSVENATENRAVNQVEGMFEVRHGSVEVAATEKYELIVANILAEPLRNLAGPVTSMLGPGGVLVLSGLLDIQADSVSLAYEKQGLGTPERQIDGEWAALVWK